MVERYRFKRRNRVDERGAAAIAVVSGIVAVFSGASPTGVGVVDVLLVFAGAAAVTWASASAPWWAVAAASGVAAVTAIHPLWAAIGAIGFIGGLYIGLARRNQSALREITGAIAVNVFVRSELEGFFGLSVIVGIAVGGALLIAGILRRPSAVRRTAAVLAGGALLYVILAMIGLGISAASASPDLRRGADMARSGIDALETGDYELAADRFEDAAEGFDRAASELGGALAAPSRIVPVFAQNVDAGAKLADEASEALLVAAGALRAIDLDTLGVDAGSIDLVAVADLEQPLLDVQSALHALEETTEDVRSPWLLGPLQDELDELDAEFEENDVRLQNAIDAVRLAPQMLGADEPRRYLVLFTTPAEARGLGGFIGNYAELTVDDGLITVNRDFAPLDSPLAPHVAVMADDFEAAVERLGACDVAFRFGPGVGPDGVRRAVVTDPTGNVFEITDAQPRP